MVTPTALLTINSGSSSLKFALFHRGDPPERVLTGRVERIGLPEARWVVQGRPEEDRPVEAADHRAAVRLVIDGIERAFGFSSIAVVGFRVVHGGNRYSQPERVTSDLVDELRRLGPCDPDHMPAAIDLIEAFREHRPDLPQVACFDTAFHHDMPRVAQIVAIPRRFEALGVRRYGFHGLSYTFMMEELSRVAGPDEALGRVILAHLGSGASLAAVQGGRSIDTSMGFTPASGLVMGTRSGDLDPGLVRFLSNAEGMTAERFDDLANHKSGLLGVSETSPDVRDLLARSESDPRAAEAIDLFCYQAKKGIGAFAAALGGLDSLVFAGGIGENSPEIRRRICDGMGHLGIEIDAGLNESSSPLISTGSSRTKVRIIRTDEEVVIAKAAARLVPNPQEGVA